MIVCDKTRAEGEEGYEFYIQYLSAERERGWEGDSQQFSKAFLILLHIP